MSKMHHSLTENYSQTHTPLHIKHWRGDLLNEVMSGTPYIRTNNILSQSLTCTIQTYRALNERSIATGIFMGTFTYQLHQLFELFLKLQK